MKKSPLSRADDRLAMRAAKPAVRASGRHYRCSSCGLQFPADELNPLFEDGLRAGWVCDSCF